jgi:hypothetical protein
MSAVSFDTLKYAEALKAAGVPDAQAKGQAEALAEALRQGGREFATTAWISARNSGLRWLSVPCRAVPFSIILCYACTRLAAETGCRDGLWYRFCCTL